MSLLRQTYRKRQGRNTREFLDALTVNAEGNKEKSQSAKMDKNDHSQNDDVQMAFSDELQTSSSKKAAELSTTCKRSLSPESQVSGQPESKRSLVSPIVESKRTGTISSTQKDDPCQVLVKQETATVENANLSSETATQTPSTPAATECSETTMQPVKASEHLSQNSKANTTEDNSLNIEMSDSNLAKSEEQTINPRDIKMEVTDTEDSKADHAKAQLKGISPGGLQATTSSETATPKLNSPVSANGSAIEKITYEILENIMEYLVDTDNTIHPFYKQGMLDNRFDSDDDEELVQHLYWDRNVIWEENIDISIFLTCRAFHQVAVDLFYGTNKFRFYDPDVCS